MDATLAFSIARPCDGAEAGRPPRECAFARLAADETALSPVADEVRLTMAGRSSALDLTATSLTVSSTIRRRSFYVNRTLSYARDMTNRERLRVWLAVDLAILTARQ